MSEKQLSRRHLLKLGAAGAGGLLLHLGLRAGQQAWQTSGPSGLELARAANVNVGRARIESPKVKRFELPLAIAAVKAPVRSEGGIDYYEITAKVARQEVLPGKMTTIWGYDGQWPGMTLEMRRGRACVMTLYNELPEAISCHYHGGVTPPQHDGYAENIVLNGTELPTLIQPGGSWTYEYPNIQPAATNWYHDHGIHRTAFHVYMGIAGFYLVRDDEEASLHLPQGEFEVPIVLQDRIFDSGGELVYDHNGHSGVEGDVQLVNGRPWPRMKVKQGKYRFRILNGSTWRRYDLSLSGGLQLIQIATDAGFLRSPEPLNMTRLYPAERGDYIIDFSTLAPGTTVTLRNRAREALGTTMEQVMLFEVVAGSGHRDPLPVRLTEYPDLRTASALKEVVATREFVFERENGYYVINGRIWDRERFDATPRLGTKEIWRFTNKSGGWWHPVHVHLVNFQLLDRSDPNGSNKRKPHRWELGRKDTVAVPENQSVRVIIDWNAEEYQHFTGPYMMHCHNVDHEDHDMMTQYLLQPEA
ncbi:MAG: multicopper oxidase family protein [Chloroflexi bacterium OHK40]